LTADASWFSNVPFFSYCTICFAPLLITFFVALYQGNFSINKAPATLKDALDTYEIERAKSKFGFPKDQLLQQQQQQQQAAAAAAAAATNNGGGAETFKHSPSNSTSNPTSAKKTPPQMNNHVPNNGTGSTTNTKQEMPAHPYPDRTSSTNGYVPSRKHDLPIHPTAQALKTASTSNAITSMSMLNPMSTHLLTKPTTNNLLSMPPPTATQGLQRSALFLGNEQRGLELELERPSTSSGRKSSIGGGVYQGPLVTPVSAKRPPLISVQNMDPTSQKKQNVNPYLSR
jgi:hypothetical protein